MRVVRGRLPGASALGCPSSRENISLLVLSVQPSSGENTDLRKTPPLGVSAIMLPSRSMHAMWVVPSFDSAADGIGVVDGVPDDTAVDVRGSPITSPAGGASGIARSGRISTAR